MKEARPGHKAERDPRHQPSTGVVSASALQFQENNDALEVCNGLTDFTIANNNNLRTLSR